MSNDKKPVKDDKKPQEKVPNNTGGSAEGDGPPYNDEFGVPCPNPAHPCI